MCGENGKSRLLEKGSVAMHGVKVEASGQDEMFYYGVVISRRRDLHGPGEHLLSKTPPWSGVCPGHQGTHRILEFHLTDCWSQTC